MWQNDTFRANVESVALYLVFFYVGIKLPTILSYKGPIVQASEQGSESCITELHDKLQERGYSISFSLFHVVSVNP
jgi:hypothetical protein